MALIKNLLYRFKLSLPIGFKDRFKGKLPSSILSSLREKEVWILSFPKCGRSWLKLMLCDMVYFEHPEKERIDDVSTNLLWKIDERIPRICFAHDGNPMYKSPEELEKDKTPYSDTNVVFLVRDPRDVLVSWYYEFKYRGHQEHFGPDDRVGELHEMVHKKRGGFATILAYYNSWMEAQDIPRSFKILRYEDLVQNPSSTLRSLLEQIGIASYISEASIQKAIEKNSFEAVKEREAKGAIKNSVVHKVREFQEEEGKRDVQKVRKGKIGSHLEELGDQEIRAMNEMMRAKLDERFGYDPDTSIPPS